MVQNIREIKSQLQFDGARPTLFSVQITNPANGVADIKAPFMIESTVIPELTIGTIQVPYFGRYIKLAGDRQYREWSVTVINDEDFLIRNALEEWSNKINSFEGNIRNFGSSSATEYKSRAIITQLSKTGNPLREYTFEGLFPVMISSIDLNWQPNDQIERFNTTFDYDYWTVTGGITGNAGGS